MAELSCTGFSGDGRGELQIRFLTFNRKGREEGARFTKILICDACAFFIWLDGLAVKKALFCKRNSDTHFVPSNV